MTDLHERHQNAIRIVVWNCHAGFQKYQRLVDTFNPDVAVLPEICHEGRLRAAGHASFTDMGWVGRFPNRGLGVVTFGKTRSRVHERDWDQRLEWVLPCHVRTAASAFNLFGVWAMNGDASVDLADGRGANQGSQALDAYARLLDEPTVIAGDFNNNVIWDKGRLRDWRTEVDRYAERGLVSAYHKHFGEDHGCESRPTHWWRMSIDTSYHIDYCFVPDAWTITQVWVGSPGDWLRAGDGSDHAPMVVDVMPG